MKSRTIALIFAASLLGIAAASAQNPPAAHQSTNTPGDTPTVKPYGPQTQNPLVNPSAAGTQMNWKGYGSTSNATSAHTVGSDNSGTHPGPSDGSVTPGAGYPVSSPSASPTAGGALNSAQARERLKQLGYDQVANVHQVGGSQWQATARKQNRNVRVTLDAQGNVVGER